MAGLDKALRIVEQRPCPDAPEQIRAGLKQFNDTYTAAIAMALRLDNEIQALEVFLVDEAGILHGGLLGYTQWGWLHVQVLWVANDQRKQGYGSRLLTAAEAEAARRGCRQGRLATYSFQARGFYERHGYQVWGTLDDYPPGYTAYALRKSF